MFKVLKKKNKELLAGFTLIEMFIVIAVIGILAGVVFRGTATIQSTARDTRRISDMRAVQNHLETYFSMCGHYPGGFSGGACTTTNPTTWAALGTTLVDARVISAGEFPIPPTANPDDIYSYAVQGDGNLSYVIRASLERRNRVLVDDVDGTTQVGFTPVIPSCEDVVGTRFGYCVRN